MKIKLSNTCFLFRKQVIMVIMRAFIFLLCTTVFSFTPSNVISQNSKIKIQADKSLTVDEVFDLIMDQTNYKFIYKEGIFKDLPNVHVKKGIVRTSTLLNKSLSTGNLNVIVMEDNMILVKERSKKQQKQVSGKVFDEAGLPLPGVVVLVKGTTNGVTTNFDGAYSITVPAPENVLVFSFLGFKTQEIAVGNQTTINVTLQEDVSELSEVVVTGYQQISKERSAGSYAKPEMAIIQDRTTSQNVLQRLDGLVPGLVINNAPNAGAFGGNRNILIRGVKTIDGIQFPLIVVDGVPFGNLNTINPQDVADITVLKDATAASIWGSRAANGVIVITTKRGGFNKKIKVDYDTYINIQGKPDLDYRPVLTSEQYIQTAREIFDPIFFDYPTESIYNPGNQVTRSISAHNQILYDLDRGLIDQATADARLNALANTNNLKQIEDLLYRSAYINNHTLSVQGGSNKHAFYGSIAYTDRQSSTPGESDNNYKLNLRQDLKIGKRINFRLNTDLTNWVTKAKRAIHANNTYIPYVLFQDANGNNLTVNELGLFSNEQRADLENISGINLNYTPLDELNKGFTNNIGLSARLTGGLSIDLFKGLKYEGTYGYFHQHNKHESFDSEDSYQLRTDRVFFAVRGENPGDAPTFLLPEEGGYYRTNHGFVKTWTLRNQLTYNGDFSDGLHKITTIAGYESRESLSNNRSTFTRGYDLRTQTFPLMDHATLAEGVRNTLVSNGPFDRAVLTTSPFTESESLTRFTSFYANAAYTFNNKYTINGSFRTDESNLFGVDKSAQNKPVWSVGLKWNLSKESFMDRIKWIDNMALRSTLGIAGNAPRPGGSASVDLLATVRTNRNAFSAPLTNEITTPGNKTLSWESTRTLNLGLDFGFFNNRIRGSFDYYKSKTSDLLNEVDVDVLSGFRTITGNLGTLENKGIELSLQTLNIDGAFSWRTSFNFARNKNKLVSYNDRFAVIALPQTLNGYPREGYDMLSIFAYNYAGLDDQGNAQVQLADGSIASDTNDVSVEDLLHMGSYQPKWSGGFTNSFSYKGLTLTANMVYNLGHVMNADTQRDAFGKFLERGNIHPDFLNRWQQPGDEANTNVPRYTARINNSNAFFHKANIHVISASYIKLRDISLNYSLPDAIIQKINASRVSFRLMLNNVMLWKENDKGIDPEFHNAISGSRITPSNQNSITFGMHLTF